MSWYHYRQNNSGGGFDSNPSQGTSINVYIEADSADEANDRAQTIGIYFDGVEGDMDCSEPLLRAS